MGVSLSSGTRVSDPLPPSFSGHLPAFCSHGHSGQEAWRGSDGGGASLGRPIVACVSGEGQMLPAVPPGQEVWVGRALVWEAGVLAAAANWGGVCRLPGSGIPGGTSCPDPRGLAAPREGALARNL